MSVLDARMLRPPRLSFDPAIPSRVSDQAYQGLRKYGPFEASRVNLASQSVIFVFPESLRIPARKLVMALRDGYRTFPGFSQMFRTSFTNDHVESLVVQCDFSSLSTAARRYQEAIAEWNSKPRCTDPKLAIVLVPQSERWETD